MIKEILDSYKSNKRLSERLVKKIGEEDFIDHIPDSSIREVFIHCFLDEMLNKNWELAE